MFSVPQQAIGRAALLAPVPKVALCFLSALKVALFFLSAQQAIGRAALLAPVPKVALFFLSAAIAVADEVIFTLTDKFSRCFGVFRERDGGRGVFFDAIFQPQTTVPQAGREAVVVRRYMARHNVGHFRFVECGGLDGGGDPTGDVVPRGELWFPFDPELRRKKSLNDVEVVRRAAGPDVEERYTMDAAGIVDVVIKDVDSRYEQRARLGG
jgi:hypothetical protein